VPFEADLEEYVEVMARLGLQARRRWMSCSICSEGDQHGLRGAVMSVRRFQRIRMMTSSSNASGRRGGCDCVGRQHLLRLGAFEM